VLAGAAATLVALVSGGVVDAAIVLGAIVAIQQLEGNVFYPMVVGKRLQLHPVAILLALTAGGVLAGVAARSWRSRRAVVSAVIDYMRERRRVEGTGLVAPRSLRPMDAAMREYYEQRAPEYDDWVARDRPVRDPAIARAGTRTWRRWRRRWARSRPPRTLDVACGTGFLTATCRVS
jgi:hypothetical protein